MEEYASHIPKLVEAIAEGKNSTWRKNKYDLGGMVISLHCCVSFLLDKIFQACLLRKAKIEKRSMLRDVARIVLMFPVALASDMRLLFGFNFLRLLFGILKCCIDIRYVFFFFW